MYLTYVALSVSVASLAMACLSFHVANRALRLKVKIRATGGDPDRWMKDLLERQNKK